VTTQGALLEIEGKAENGRIILSGSNQKGELIRGTWEPASEGVHEIAVKSLDGGKTWQPWFDIMFQAHGAMDEAPGDEDEDAKKTVAALDSEYQNAVKHNDAQTMDRILADDFVLVTSSGKTYSKSDLIQDAKSGRATYEHQEDTDKTVRLWGDTAIVTANLWEKGVQDGKPFEHRLWFSDVYRRTPAGWRYVFAQSAYRPN
jgi:ketosteroid isomerase-like protein